MNTADVYNVSPARPIAFSETRLSIWKDIRVQQEIEKP